jgi:hypothetical protein
VFLTEAIASELRACTYRRLDLKRWVIEVFLEVLTPPRMNLR